MGKKIRSEKRSVITQKNNTPPQNPSSLKEKLLSNRPLQLVLLLTIAALFLRLYQLGFNSLWLDEASTLGFARHSLGEIWGFTASGEFNPPLFYWMEHMMLIFGESEFVLRLLPAIFGALTIPLFYLVGRELIDEQTGIIAAALLVVSPFHIFYSQDARAYVPMLFFFALACWFYLLARRRGLIVDWVLFGIAGSLAVWTHFYAIVPVGVLVLFEAVTRGREYLAKERPLIPTAAGIAVLAITMLPLLIVGIGLFISRTGTGAVFGTSGLPLILSTIESLSGFSTPIAILFIILFITGLIGLFMNRREETLLLILLFITPLIISLLLAGSMPMVPRYLIAMILPFFIGIAAVFRLIPDGLRSPHVLAVAVLVLCLIQVPFLAGYYTTYSKNDWRGFSGALSEVTEPGDVIVLVPGYMRQPLDYYYSNATDGTLQFGATTADNLESLRFSHPEDRIFFIMTGDIFAADPSGGAYTWLEQNTGYAGSLTGIHLFVLSE